MRSAERSLIVFGVYLALVGLSLVFAPNVVLAAVGLPATGVLAFALACYFVAAGRNAAEWFTRTSIAVRIVFPAALLAALR